MSRTRLVALALAATAVIASGCGGSTKTGAGATSQTSASTTATGVQTVASTPANALTQAQLVAAANRICAHANALVAKPGHAGKSSSNQEIAQNAREISGYDRAEVASLHALVPPTELAGDMKQIVAGFQTYAGDVSTLGIYVQTNNNSAIQPLVASATKLHEEIAAIAKRDGMTACAKPTP